MNTLSIEHSFHKLKDIAEEVLLLNLQDVADVEKLEQLQSQQEVIRNHIKNTWPEKSFVLTDHLKQVIIICTELEKQIKVKLECFQREINENLKGLKDADFAREKYQSKYIQTEGYFLDEHQ
jgi:ABC-type microcin C transport system duplicated ATPase subunit YejF